MGTSSVSPTGFTGTSLFSQDLQNAITRAISIASLPIQQLSNEQSTLNGQLSELNQVSGQFTALQSAINNLASATSNSALSANVSDNSIVTATATGTALTGTYTVQVLDPGTFASALSNSTGLLTVTDPTSQNLSSSTSFTLKAGNTTYPTFSASNLDALAAAINQSGAPVQATVINVGSPSSPNYQLAVQATTIGANTIQVTDGTNQTLLTGLAPGTNATYTVNGQPPGGISSPSRTVTIAPGLTANLKSVGTATISVAGNTGNISNALQSFASVYNAVVDELAKNRGQNGGALVGDSIVQSASQALHSIASYSTGSSGFSTLESIGLGFDPSGHLQFDPSQISSLSQTRIAQLTSFLGSPTSGGFLQAAANTLTGLIDPNTGLLTQAVTNTNSQITQTAQQISDDTDKINALQTSLEAQMSAADALIATLEQQNNFITGLFSQLSANSYASR